MPAIGYVLKQEDGSYRGELKTALVRKPLEIRPMRKNDEDRQPEFRVFVDNDVEIGTARTEVNHKSHAQYIKVTIAVPEFGPKYLTANLGPAPGYPEGTLALLWNPEQPDQKR